MSSPRKLRADGERTRDAIVRQAVSLATLDGLEGLSIGNLAGALDMSKSGIYAHFDSKQDLQLATVTEAGQIFHAEVIEPALAAAPGLPQLVAVCDAFFDHLVRRTFPGGCFFAGAVLEMGTRPGPVKEEIAAFLATSWSAERSGTLGSMAMQVNLDPELQSIVERARKRASERGESLPGPVTASSTELSPAARAALADWVTSGDYDRAVAEITADDPDLATQ